MSLLFNPIVGGAMTARNLKDVQQPGAARVALVCGILYTVLTMYLLARFLPLPFIPWLSWFTSILAGLALEAYAKRFIADWHLLPVKSNFKPIVICLLVSGLLFGLAFVATPQHAH
ncbi:hypothetical protein [Hymenobacter negativus]|uniref:hypothetical protein n=1 Tax=Hymenobacter negativus TaxID=2795026 RepID=UPI0018DC8B01|nr:hypothetical protein [Hymenobacter negativus]